MSSAVLFALLLLCLIPNKELKIEEFLPEVLNINPDAINHFEFNDLLRENYNELLKTIDENEKLLKSDSLNGILEELKKNEIELLSVFTLIFIFLLVY